MPPPQFKNKNPYIFPFGKKNVIKSFHKFPLKFTQILHAITSAEPQTFENFSKVGYTPPKDGGLKQRSAPNRTQLHTPM